MTPIQTALQHMKLPFPLHDYQVEDITAACASDSFGYYLDLGLGKTVCSLTTAVYKLVMGGYDCCYVLCPASLISQWVGVIESFGLEGVAYRGTPKQRKEIDRSKYDFLVMSYQIYQKDYDILKEAKPYFIVDEATNLCDKNNLLYKMLLGGKTTKELPKPPGQIKPEFEVKIYEKQNRGCSLLTGTPINKPTDAYGLISITNPTAYRNYGQFCRIHIAEKNQWGAASEYDNLDLLKENLLRNATLRHTSDHIDLPTVTFKTVKYELSPAHMKLYRKLLDEKVIELDGVKLIDAIQANSLYHYAQRIIFSPDLAGTTIEPAGFELLDTLLNSVRPYLVFSNYKATNYKIMHRYDLGGLYGEISAKDKERYIEDFKEGRLKGLACHARSSGVGLDFPHCAHTFFTELPITPRDFRQCCGRTWRQGQKNRCVIVVMFAKGTIQEALLKKIVEKDELMQGVIDLPRILKQDLLSDITEISKPKSKKQLVAELFGETC